MRKREERLVSLLFVPRMESPVGPSTVGVSVLHSSMGPYLHTHPPTSSPCFLSQQPCLQLFFARLPSAYWSSFPVQEGSLGLHSCESSAHRLIILQSSLGTRLKLWPRGALLGFLSCPVLPFPPCLPVSPSCTSLISHLHVNLHFRICFWESFLRHKSSRAFSTYASPPHLQRESTEMAEEECLTLRSLHFQWALLSPNRYVWESSWTFQSWIFPGSSRMGLG